MIPQIPTAELAALGSEAVLIDVREDDEYAAARVAGSVHIPMSAFVARLAEVPKDETVYIMCAAGVRSAQVSAFLNQQGYDAVNVDGGLTAWQQAGLPVERPFA
jgi:rhodanese-related sulfurtransferase